MIKFERTKTYDIEVIDGQQLIGCISIIHGESQFISNGKSIRLNKSKLMRISRCCDLHQELIQKGSSQCYSLQLIHRWNWEGEAGV